MRIAVIDDSAFMRRAVERMLASDPALEIVGRGRNGLEAVEIAKTLQPDCMTLDIEMPEMDGLTALRRIMREAPCKVVMVSSLTTEGSVAALRALKLGAADVVAKDHSTFSTTIEDIRDELVHKVKALAHEARRTRGLPADARSPRRPSTGSPGSPEPGKASPARPTSHVARLAAADRAAHPAAPPATEIDLAGRRFDLVCIGSSTGGPPVLERVLPAFPAGFAAPVVVAQHMPELFTESMARRLDDVCALPVVHGKDGQSLQPGTITICRGGRHTRLTGVAGRLRVHTTDAIAGETFKPSASVLFESAAKACRGPVLAAVLTGIGDDGCRGAAAVQQAGGTVLAQSADTCVVYGMPRAVTEAGLAAACVTPDGLARAFRSMHRAAAA
jgi:two-component system chemotaxis response regulator CheB